MSLGSVLFSPPVRRHVGFFPEPLDDELAYSIFSAFHCLSGHRSSHATRTYLFGQGGAFPDLAVFGSRVYPLLSRFGDASPSIARAWVWNHTMYPVWGAFLTPLANDAWLATVLAGHGRGYRRLANNWSVRFLKKSFGFCIECLNEDNFRFGRSAWRRSPPTPWSSSLPPSRSGIAYTLSFLQTCVLQSTEFSTTLSNMQEMQQNARRRRSA